MGRTYYDLSETSYSRRQIFGDGGDPARKKRNRELRRVWIEVVVTRDCWMISIQRLCQS